METLGKRKRKQVQWPCVLCDKECKVTGSATNRLRSIECSECRLADGYMRNAKVWRETALSYWLAARRSSAAQLRNGLCRLPWRRCRPISIAHLARCRSNGPSYGVSRYVSVSWCVTICHGVSRYVSVNIPTHTQSIILYKKLVQIELYKKLDCVSCFLVQVFSCTRILHQKSSVWCKKLGDAWPKLTDVIGRLVCWLLTIFVVCVVCRCFLWFVSFLYKKRAHFLYKILDCVTSISVQAVCIGHAKVNDH